MGACRGYGPQQLDIAYIPPIFIGIFGGKDCERVEVLVVIISSPGLRSLGSNYLASRAYCNCPKDSRGGFPRAVHGWPHDIPETCPRFPRFLRCLAPLRQAPMKLPQPQEVQVSCLIGPCLNIGSTVRIMGVLARVHYLLGPMTGMYC